jgi:hypothetical protein
VLASRNIQHATELGDTKNFLYIPGCKIPWRRNKAPSKSVLMSSLKKRVMPVCNLFLFSQLKPGGNRVPKTRGAYNEERNGFQGQFLIFVRK